LLEKKTTLYNIMILPIIAPTTMLAAKPNSPDPDPVIVGAAAEPERDEPLAVDVAEAVAVFGYKSELLYVVQELVAGIVGLPPGSFWLSPKQDKNSLGW